MIGMQTFVAMGVAGLHNAVSAEIAASREERYARELALEHARRARARNIRIRAENARRQRQADEVTKLRRQVAELQAHRFLESL